MERKAEEGLGEPRVYDGRRRTRGDCALAVSCSACRCPREATIAKQKAENIERPIAPSTRKRTIIVGVSRGGPPSQATLSINYGEFAEMKVDVSSSRYTSFKVSIGRVNQGRVAVLDGLEKDSNGHLRLSMNAGAFGPGDYMVAIEGLTMRRESVPVGWFGINVSR